MMARIESVPTSDCKPQQYLPGFRKATPIVFAVAAIVISIAWQFVVVSRIRYFRLMFQNLLSNIDLVSLLRIFISRNARTSKIVFAHLFLCVIIQAQTVSSASVRKPCRKQPSLIGKCFFAYGRLALYNGAPTIRLFRPDTKRILGVSASYAKEGYSSIPTNLEKQLGWDTDLWGNFLVCPFTRQRPKEMQMMCIEKATKTVIKKRL